MTVLRMRSKKAGSGGILPRENSKQARTVSPSLSLPLPPSVFYSLSYLFAVRSFSSGEYLLRVVIIISQSVS